MNIAGQIYLKYIKTAIKKNQHYHNIYKVYLLITFYFTITVR